MAHMASSAPLERSPCSSKRRRTLLLSASARRYGWFRRSAGSRQSARTHGHGGKEGRTDRHEGKVCWKPIKAARGGRERGAAPAAARGRTGVPQLRDRLILVGSGRCWEQGMGMLLWEWPLTTATSTPSGALRCSTLPQTPELEDVPDGSCVTPQVQPHQDGFRIPAAHLEWIYGIIKVGKDLQDLKEVPWGKQLALGWDSPAAFHGWSDASSAKGGESSGGNTEHGMDGWMDDGRGRRLMDVMVEAH